MRSPANEGRKAVAAVELALLLPLLTLLFVAAVDFARIFYYAQLIESCARNGALYACDPKAPAYNLYSSVQEAALADVSSLNPQPTVSSTTGIDSAGNDYVAVTVTWPFKPITICPGVPSTVIISRTVQMRQLLQ